MTETQNHQADDLVARAVAATLQLPLPDGPLPVLAVQTLRALHQAAIRPKSSLRQTIRHSSWKSKAAALLGIAAAALVAYILLSASTGNSVALAQVAAKVEGASTLSFVQTTEPLDGKTPKTTYRFTSLGADKTRTESQSSKPEEEMISISDYVAGKEIYLWPAKKKALINTVKGRPTYDNSLVERREAFRDYLKWPSRSLGHKLIDGVECTGFEVDQGNHKTRIWADAKTGNPVRSENDDLFLSPPQWHCKVVWDYKIDEKVDPALFSVEPPEGYTVEQNSWVNDLSKTPAQLVTSILRTYAESMDGQFPARLTDRGQSMFADLKKKGLLDSYESNFHVPVGQKTEWNEQAEKMGNLIVSFCQLSFFLSGKRGVDYAYYPGGTLGEKDRIMFWYKDEKSGEYMAIYGDLRVEKIDKEKLPHAAESPNTGEK